jgi:hypothetical protein
VDFSFLVLFLAELVVRLIAVGPVEFFTKWWNLYDPDALCSCLVLTQNR